jgi:hypothetical protein
MAGSQNSLCLKMKWTEEMVGFELYGHLDDIYHINIHLGGIIEMFMVDT